MNAERAIAVTATLRPERLYHGWCVVAAAFLIALFGWGLGFYGPGIYLVALQQQHGWSASEISSAITAYYLAGATLILLFGGVFERWGARTVVAVGAIAMACSVVLLTLIARPWQIYGVFAVMALGWAAMSGAAVNIIIAPWFDKRRGLAVSLALNGASAGGVLIAPLLTFLISHAGFAAALPRIAGLMLAIVLPAVLLLRRKRPNERDRADQSNDVPVRMPRGAAIEPASRWRPSEVLRSANFLTIAASFSLGLMVQVGFLTHQVAYLSPRLGTVAAGWAVSLTTFSAIIGRVVIGSFIEKVDCRMAAGGNFCVQIAGMSLLSANASITGLLLGCVLFGLGLGNLITLPGVIVQREFPKQHFARIVSLIVAINQFAFAFGPGLIGYLRQAQGDYAGALRACLAAEAMAAITVMTPPLWRGVARRLGSRRAINELPGRSFSRDRGSLDESG